MAKSHPLHTEINRDLEIGLRQADLTDRVDRLILSDQLESVGRDREAIYLRSPNPCHLVGGRIEAREIRVTEIDGRDGFAGRRSKTYRARLIVCRTDQRGHLSESGVVLLETSSRYLAKSAMPHSRRATILRLYEERAVAERSSRGWVDFEA